MSRLPVPGQDSGTWGSILNDYLSQAHNSDGTLKAGSVGATQLQSNAFADATSTTKGAIQLAGDINGTAAAPQIAKIQGIALSGTPIAGQALIATSGTAASWSTLPAAPVTSVAGKTGAVSLAEGDIANLSTDLAARPSDYVVSVSGGTYTATPRPGSGLAAYSGTDFTTILQNAVSALTTGAPGAGSVGSGGGKIHIATGQYTMGNAITITGWEGALTGLTPFKSQLIIEGEGNGTEVIQNTSGQHAFIVKNGAQVSFLDIRGFVGVNAYAFLYGDKTGTDTEASILQGTLRMEINSHSSTWPAMYLKNFMDIRAEYLEVSSALNHGIVLENDSSSVYYGNSSFGFVRAWASTSSPYAGLVIRSTNTNPLFGITFDNYQTISGYYGLYINGTYGVTFNFVDIESCTYGVYLDGVTNGIHSSYVNILSGYVFAPSGGACVYNAAGAFGNKITLHCDPPVGGGSNTPLNDQNTTLSPCNTYDLQLFNAAAVSAMVFADATKQNITVSCFDGTYLRRVAGASTAAGSVVTVDGTQTLTNKTINNPTFTNPKISQINDTNGNAILTMSPGSASAVNHVAIFNEATGTGAAISATGTDTNVDLLISGQGTGKVKVSNDGSYRQVATLDGAETLSGKTLSSPSIGNPTFTGLVSGGINFYGTNEGLSFYNSGATAELAALGVAQNAGNWSSIAAANDAVLRVATNNLIITAKNASGSIIFATGASDTEKARITNAGVLQVGGVAVPTISSADTLTNKRINSRVNSVASSATPAINTDTTDEFDITALATAITSMTTNLTGTPVNGQILRIRIKDNGSAQSITWGSKFVSTGLGTLLTTTSAGKTHRTEFIYDSTAALWACVRADATGY